MKDFESEHKEFAATNQKAEEFLERFHVQVEEEQPTTQLSTPTPRYEQTIPKT